MQRHHIRALTGVRFFAALAVIGYHHLLRYPNVLADTYPDAIKVARPVLINGSTGVDLFFVLSGFVLAYNYLGVLGAGWKTRDTLRFLWLRLARIWPLYAFALVLAAALMWFRWDRWGSAPIENVTWPRFFDQLFLVVMWHRPHTGGAAWAGPMWTISAEWLAYLLFPVLALVALRLRSRLPAWALFLASAVVLSPLVIQVVVEQSITAAPYAWLSRILCEFTAGVLISCATSKLAPSTRARARADRAAIGCVVGALALCFLAAYVTLGWQGQLVIAFYPPLVAFLAIANGPLSRFLSRPLVVLGGAISYGMYLIHSQLLYLYRDVASFSRFHLDGAAKQRGELLWIVVIILAALVLHKLLEEPVRRRMTRLVHKPGSDRAPGVSVSVVNHGREG